jgi:hypothetical protein
LHRRTEGASAPSVLLTVDKPFWQGFDKHGGFVKGDGNPPSRYILAKSEYNSDFAAQAVELLRQLEERKALRRLPFFCTVFTSHAVLTDQEAFEKI